MNASSAQTIATALTGVTVPAVVRAVAILEAVAASEEPVRAAELCNELGLARSTMSNLISSLEAVGMLRRSGNGWLIGYKALEIGQSAISGTDLTTQFRDIAASLPHLRAETTLLATLDGPDVLYLARRDGTQSVRLASDIGRKLPAVVTALGKAMLAALEPAEIEAFFERYPELPHVTPRSHRTHQALYQDLVKTKARGWALDDEQNTVGVLCLSVSVPHANRPLAVSTTLLSARITDRLKDALIKDLTTLANRLGVIADSQT